MILTAAQQQSDQQGGYADTGSGGSAGRMGTTGGDRPEQQGKAEYQDDGSDGHGYSLRDGGRGIALGLRMQ
jgi:hypothetical protein